MNVLRRLAASLVLLSLMSLCAVVIAQDVGGQADVRLVIDVSGSMKRNDPQNLRQPAVDLLVRLLPQESRAGVWTFGKYVNMLVPHGDVDEQWRKTATEKAPEINSVGLFTNIGEALEKAAKGSGLADDGYSKSIILLTDGMVDIDKNPQKNQAEWRRIVEQVIPELRSKGITVHTVALSDNADTNLMEKLALATDGAAAVAHTAEDLMQVFLKAFDLAAPAQQVPLEGNTFAVDSSVEEFTALIFRQNPEEQTRLVGPDQTEYSNDQQDADARWFRSSEYDLVTVRKPIEGEWVIHANVAPESRITVVSDLQLKVKSLPNNAYSGAQETLTFMLQEEGRKVEDQAFLSLLTITAQMGVGSQDVVTQQVWSHDYSQFSPPANGVFTTPMPQLRKVGVYQLSVEVDGKTFRRHFQHRIVVREPFTAELQDQVDDNGISHKRLAVRSHSDSIIPADTQIVATVENPLRRKKIQPMSVDEFDVWHTNIYPEQPGLYRIRIQVKGKDVRGKSFEYSLTAIEFKHDPDAGFVEEEPEPVSSQSSSVSSAPEPEVIEEVVDEEPTEEAESTEEAVAESTPMPTWLLYVLLGLGNVVILGGGYFLFRKLMSDGDDAEIEDESEEAEEPAPEPPEPMLEEDPVMDMDSGDDEEEEPPMEDLESDEPALSEPEPDDSPPEDIEPEPVAAEVSEEEPMIDDFGVDDLEEDTPEEPADEDVSEEQADNEAADLASEMLKAQGLDLAEDELDDAITNLIDELDGEPSGPPDDSEGSDLDDFDFDEDDLK